MSDGIVIRDGDIVEHEGQLWRNIHSAGNAWEPGNPQHQWEQVVAHV